MFTSAQIVTVNQIGFNGCEWFDENQSEKIHLKEKVVCRGLNKKKLIVCIKKIYNY